METWRKTLRGYEFMLWDTSRFDLNKTLWTRQAFDVGLYACAADYIRLYAVYEYGGIYLDMDMEVLKPFNDLLSKDLMLAYENHVGENLEAGCFGAAAGHPYIKKCMEYFEERAFFPPELEKKLLALPRSERHDFIAPLILPEIMKTALRAFSEIERPLIYNRHYFTAKNIMTGKIESTPETYTIHHFATNYHSAQWRAYREGVQRIYAAFGEGLPGKTIALAYRGFSRLTKKGLAASVRYYHQKFLQKKPAQSAAAAAKTSLCAVVIPVYKRELSHTDRLSLRQCLRLLSAYEIVFVTYQQLDTCAYSELCREHGVHPRYEYFPRRYFTAGLYGYNALMLSKQFYRRFLGCQYTLIYQLDAYVFRDELSAWCEKGYDYIGAPWFSSTSIDAPPQPGSKYHHIVGNGGFSLRKPEAFLRLYSAHVKRMFLLSSCLTFFTLLAEKSKKNPLCKIARLLLFPAKLLINTITMKVYDAINEDVVWARALERGGKLPAAEEAARFSFEDHCDYLYEELTKRELPFGCHGWTEYYRYRLFWKQFIQV